jgi:CheY-like chemotaxis protein
VLIEDRQACVDSGMNDFLPKPIRMSELRRVLRKATDRSR